MMFVMHLKGVYPFFSEAEIIEVKLVAALVKVSKTRETCSVRDYSHFLYARFYAMFAKLSLVKLLFMNCLLVANGVLSLKNCSENL